jgi:hypothetical protein
MIQKTARETVAAIASHSVWLLHCAAPLPLIQTNLKTSIWMINYSALSCASMHLSSLIKLLDCTGAGCLEEALLTLFTVHWEQ